MTTIFIAMPTQGQVRTETALALIDLTQHLRAQGVAFSMRTFEGSDVVMSRNALMSQFLTEAEFTHTLLLDADMSFHPDVVLRLLQFGAAFACAAYPQRTLSLERFRELAEQDATLPETARRPTEALLAAALRYNVQESLDPGAPWVCERRDGFRTVPGAGTGLMLIARRVPETMVARGVAPARPRHDEMPGYGGARFHDFFSHLTDRDGRLIYGEDQSFCRRWVAGCGGKIWCDETAVVTHHGAFSYRGRYREQS